ncbi:hypothetical protein CLAFUW4_13522 [Fulvia fulva]|uniref:Uncharacterized protein n=1 Tax=Passalora fulva TaxID=5499 RepID=A0A9Q8UVS6_PASFU|nr:uncharacterized protein CLAFUR5_13373 [Fulvia fulva]KAK4610469.1 hypothetical protein CLAFUR4_13524 [Fulvia fulva]KAK4611001.1 hypothetical protein CLAFUR0_13533 [Fulvia fulva]UJO24296.1 hypothetical protein CLAFUR5_13373 [Fulvia fulva]WPV22120.1 hypothetical protein CLAFUW4_13522 [Fulvia fulva]WPV36861.1 hypothetical protein CLAFUW7_13529 [Fulvia fulva]
MDNMSVTGREGSPKRRLSQSSLATDVENSPRRRRKPNTATLTGPSAKPSEPPDNILGETTNVLQPLPGSSSEKYGDSSSAEFQKIQAKATCESWEAGFEILQDKRGPSENGGVIALQERAEKLRSSGPRRHRLEMDALEKRIEILKQDVEQAQQQQDDSTIETNQEFAALMRKAREIYTMCSAIDIRGYLTSWNLPDPIFEQFDRCSELESQSKELRRERIRLQAEQIGKRDEIQVILARIFELRSSCSPGHEPDTSELETQIKQLRESPELLTLDKECQWYSAELDAVELDQSRAENTLYQTLEGYFLARELLVDKTVPDLGPENSPQDISVINSRVCCTPAAGSLEEADGTQDFATQLTKRLAPILKAHFQEARQELESSQSRLEALRDAGDIDPAERALAESPDHAIFLAKRERTREVIKAEEKFNDVCKRAQDAGIAGVPARSTGFSDHPSDGYGADTVEAHIKLTDVAGIEKWIDTETSSKKRVLFAQSDIVQMLEPSEPEERPDLEPLVLGESYSTIAQARQRGHIDVWLRMQTPQIVSEKDVFKSRGWRMSV